MNIAVIELEICDGTCIDEDPEGQCESCADLEIRKELGVIPYNQVLIPKGDSS